MKAFTQGSVADAAYNAIARSESVCREAKAGKSVCLQIDKFGPKWDGVPRSATDVDDLEAAANGNRLHGSDTRMRGEVHAVVIRHQIDVAA